MFQLFSMQIVSQNIMVDKTITKDTVIALLIKDKFSNAIVASGKVGFKSKTGYVRILLSDEYGYDLLVYETFPLLATDGIDEFNSVALETIYIPSDIIITKARVEIKNADLSQLSLSQYNTIMIKDAMQKTKKVKIEKINENLKKQKALWGAGETSISKMSYEEKKKLFGGKVPDLQGFEYYKSGIFVINKSDDSLILMDSSKNSKLKKVANRINEHPFVSEFDWRNRHGRNWITPTKNQECNDCWAFSAVGTTETYVNLYYNQLLNLNLSEQNILSCSNAGDCYGGNTGGALEYIRNTGVADENSYPYHGVKWPCSNNLPNEIIKIGNSLFFDPNSQNADDLKKLIIKCPVSFCISSWNHSFVVIGFKTLQEGDSIAIKNGSETLWSHIDSGNPLIGEDAWILKNSRGTNWGENGCAYIITDWSEICSVYSISGNISSLNYTNDDVVCSDEDGDGFYFWGIGERPITCPTNAPVEPDGDDSNPYLGPIDEYGNCESITPDITTSQTWNTNKVLNRNIYIASGAILTVNSATIYLNNYTITIRDGAKLILSGGIADGGTIIAQSGSELTLENNGKLLLANNDNLNVQYGAVFNQIFGEVLLK